MRRMMMVGTVLLFAVLANASGSRRGTILPGPRLIIKPAILPTCGYYGGTYCNQSGPLCPHGFRRLPPTSDCAACCTNR